jgi:uncharacterized protein YndB with AHSA1/START domain
MDQHLFVEKKIEIGAPAAAVWRVFTDPVLSRKMGGEYVTDWNAGSSIGWKALDGMLLTRGTILEIQPGRRFSHELFDLAGSVNSVISYELRETAGRTLLQAREDFKNPLSDLEYEDALEGWDEALGQVKQLAEDSI